MNIQGTPAFVAIIVCLILTALGAYSATRPAVADSGGLAAVLIAAGVLGLACVAVIWALSAAPARAAECAEAAGLRDALERIALLDEADGHELKLAHAFRAVGIASQTLGKHPSEIFAERYARGCYTTAGCKTK